MKIIKIVFILLIAISSQIQSQTVWSPSGAEWYYNFQQFDVVGYTKIKYIGDTSIYSKQCKILEKIQFAYSYSSNKYDTIMLGKEYTYSEDDTVFYFRFNKFFVLYNFDASSGDTWEIAGTNNYSECDSVSNLMVDKTDSININGFNLKRLHINYNDTNKWLLYGQIIERIGATSYMFPLNNCVIDAKNEGGSLRCYYDNEFGHYTTEVQKCDTIIKTGITDNFLPEIYLYPNIIQSFNSVNIRSKKSIEKIEIYNIQGQPIYNTSVHSNYHQLNVNFLKNGLYILIINNTSHKLVVNR